MTIATGILVMVAMAVGGTLAVAVLYAVITRGRNWWRELFSLRTIPFLFVGFAVGVTTLGIGWAEKEAADDELRLAVDDIEADCEDQLTLLLHANAIDFAFRYGVTNNLSHEAVLQLCEYYGIDEFSLVGADGCFIDTTVPGAKVGDSFFIDEETQAPYRALLNGTALTVSQRFRQSSKHPDKVLKFFAMALPPVAGNSSQAAGNRFLQIGYLWESFEREFTRLFLPIFETRQIGGEGFCMVLDEKNTLAVAIPGHPDSKGKSAVEIGLTAAKLALPLGKIFRAKIYGMNYRCMGYPETIANYRIYAAMPLAERQEMSMVLAGGIAFILFAAYLIFRLILRKFQQQQARIDALRATEENRRATDLALARSIQRAELRTDGTEGDGYRIATLMTAAREVGGDFYDYYELPDGRLILTIADVSGKGVPAAFFMMKARVTLKSCVYSSANLATAVAKANVRLSHNNPAEMFVTVWIGAFSPKTGMLEYVSAGHNPPLVKGSDGSVAWVNASHCAALGIFENAKYCGAKISLTAGDRLFLYTDGITEAMNPAGEIFGNERLEATLNGASDNLISTVSRAVESFVAGAEQSDDITILELETKSLGRGEKQEG